ncbi:superoxide dismutase family protein [Streptomyces albofaciens]|uniref:superoxide dismutase family protein n=1 Tax=Streptomyces albofaciens TaxID=66866 RepID=UPI001FCB5D45|nr:superoxide dismutase family protein [Streptomyces albofaciens]
MSIATAVLTASLAMAPATAPALGVQCTSVTVRAHFAASPTGEAVTYDQALVPEGSRVTVVEKRYGSGKDARTAVSLRLSGLVPDRTYGAHVHTKPCGPKPNDSGPHYQNVPDPVQPSTDPAYANPRNEIWLDMRTDEDGRGSSTAKVAWHVRYGEARSVVVHEHGTHTEPGHAGTAGARLACVNVPLA